MRWHTHSGVDLRKQQIVRRHEAIQPVMEYGVLGPIKAFSSGFWRIPLSEN